MAIDYSKSVLVVNDTASMTNVIVSLLRKIGFTNIDDASNGLEALAKMKTEKYALVISDWQMEPVNGQELLEKIRAIPQLAATPFIMVTAHPEPTGVISARLAGADSYIGIPFTLSTLKNKITEVLDS
jgi:two-component system, chemotaxis family, chemotaxis protein CheY